MNRATDEDVMAMRSECHVTYAVSDAEMKRIFEWVLSRRQVTREALLGLLTRLFNEGYHSGHNDTIDSCFIDPRRQDRLTHNREIVEGIIGEIGYEEINKMLNG